MRDITDFHKLNDQPLSHTVFTDTQIKLINKNPAETKFNVYAYVVKAVNRLGTESGPSP